MKKEIRLKAPFFEIGPKSYLYGDDVLALAMAADRAAMLYDVDILFTAPYTEIRRVAEAVKRVIVLAPHMDAIRPGRGVASILPEGIKAAGAGGVMLNHCERPLSYGELQETVMRARELQLLTVVCAGSVEEAMAVAYLSPDVVVAEPPELVGTGKSAEAKAISQVVEAVRGVNSNILVLTAAGITNGRDVYKNIYAGADATGSSSGIVCAKQQESMIHEMVRAVRTAYDDRICGLRRIK